MDIQTEKTQTIACYRIAQSNCTFSFKFQDSLEHVIALPNYEGLLIFEKGKLFKVNFLLKTILQESQIDKEIKKVVMYDKETIVYITQEAKKIKFFNFVRCENVDIMNIDLPTQSGMPNSERTDSAKDDLFRDGMELVVLPESKYVVLLEIKNTYSTHQNENVITAFHESQQGDFFSQVKYSEPNQKMFFMERLNKRDTICVYTQLFENAPVEFLIWNVSKKGEGLIPQFRLTENLDGVVQHIFSFGENKAGLLANLTKGHFPCLKVFDYTQGSPAKEQTTLLDVIPQDPNSILEQSVNTVSENRAFGIQDIYLTDVENQKIIWQRFGRQGQFFDVYNPSSNKITFMYFEGEDENEEDENNENQCDEKVASVDNKYILSYCRNNSDNDDNEQKFPFMINSIVEVKSSIMHLLIKKQITDKYGEEVCKNIIDMLIRHE
ncbi:hypothetical protein TTHERM_00840180 (macronuclear) [Tetrahymena thermophila SB210]|uniref:Uncharacterized protein n=1 Tax=Tetrahymena thermophila (strain SB210) TaxID=312017 RepID=I7MAQ4_TETTS|nr:hypothetical protein TTHERM_00840180 [Tetrahymena thermophila SB210]EAS05049.2 hypothetical protein TTHERM_00840180 [Tetrahymena thermophila SB210]|eukprot:XP_001025294.2 hypothetical protein TTHERM_00840180 [Tetrahymena thermophila SB210]